MRTSVKGNHNLEGTCSHKYNVYICIYWNSSK